MPSSTNAPSRVRGHSGTPPAQDAHITPNALSIRERILLSNDIINTAQSSVTRASDDLESARAQLAGVEAQIAELDNLLDSDKPLPKGHGSKTADAQAQAQQLRRLVGRREEALRDAETRLRQAEEHQRTERIDQLGQLLSSFDRDQLEADFLAEAQPIVDRLLERAYELRAAEAELRSLIGKDTDPTDRVATSRDSYRDIIVDGQKISPLVSSPWLLVPELGTKLIDSRHAAVVAQAQTEERAQREAEAAEREARAAEFRRQNEAKWSQAPTGARVTRDKDGREQVIYARHGGATQDGLRQV